METNNSKRSSSKFGMIIIVGFLMLTFITCASRHRVGCHCFDGTESYGTGSGACSHHGGVMYWKHEYWWDE